MVAKPNTLPNLFDRDDDRQARLDRLGSDPEVVHHRRSRVGRFVPAITVNPSVDLRRMLDSDDEDDEARTTPG
jgi:hypothetical protein